MWVFAEIPERKPPKSMSAKLIVKLNTEGKGRIAHLKHDIYVHALLLFLLSRS